MSFLGVCFVVALSVIFKYGFNADTLKIVLGKIYYLRRVFFLILFISVCVKIMNSVDGIDKYLMLPFIGCGIAGLLSLYKKTRRIAIILFATMFLGVLCIFLPIAGLISSYKSGNLDNASLIFGILLIIGSISLYIYLLRNINKNYK